MSLLKVPRSDVDRWVNICFGAGRDDGEAHPASPGERILLSDALKHFGHPAVALYLLGTHYSLPLGDTLTGLATGSKNASRIREALERLVPDQPSPPDMRHHMEAFRDALANDLDTPLAFVIMFEWLLEAERRGGDVGDHDLRVMLEVLELDGLAAGGKNGREGVGRRLDCSKVGSPRVRAGGACRVVRDRKRLRRS